MRVILFGVALALTGGLLGPAAAGPAEAAQFAPHRAVYTLDLAKARGSQSAQSIGGRMQFTWEDVCDGWTIDFKARMRVTFAEQGTRQIAWNFSSWEADDGTSYRFFLRRFTGGRQTGEVRGEAELTPGEGGVARFAQPEERTVELPADTVFPQAHSDLIVERARQDDRILWRHVFDGTGEGNGLFGVNAVITRAYAPGEDLPISHPLLEGEPSWRVALAYFADQARASTPESEQTTRLFANGVAGHLTIDYGDFVVRGELAELEALERPECS